MSAAKRRPTVAPMLHRKPWSVDGPHVCPHEVKGKRKALMEYWNILDAGGFYVVECLAEQEAREIVDAVNAAWERKKTLEEPPRNCDRPEIKTLDDAIRTIAAETRNPQEQHDMLYNTDLFVAHWLLAKATSKEGEKA